MSYDGSPHVRNKLAEALLRDPEALRADVLAFLDLCRPVFFGALWAESEPLLARAAHRVRQRLADDGPVSALASLSPSSVRLADPPRVVFDKVHHAVRVSTGRPRAGRVDGDLYGLS
ncbi:DUF5937 family protein [Streptomyces niveus]|uniref:DUF5937 family protein n=1 Tax=Streptomyces niveus TaxID=193462 RepID=UPI0037164E9C